MDEEKFLHTCELRNSLSSLKTLKKIFSAPNQKISKIKKVIRFFEDKNGNAKVIWTSDLDKQTREELIKAINTIINKRIREIEKEYEEL